MSQQRKVDENLKSVDKAERTAGKDISCLFHSKISEEDENLDDHILAPDNAALKKKPTMDETLNVKSQDMKRKTTVNNKGDKKISFFDLVGL